MATLSAALKSTGSAVQQVQDKLNTLGYVGSNGAPLQVDGVFGANTTYAVRAFQSAEGLTVDGVVGSQTLQALDNALTPIEGGELDGPGGSNPMSTPGIAPAGATDPAPAPAQGGGTENILTLGGLVPEWVTIGGAVALLGLIALAVKSKKK